MNDTVSTQQALNACTMINEYYFRSIKEDAINLAYNKAGIGTYQDLLPLLCSLLAANFNINKKMYYVDKNQGRHLIAAIRVCALAYLYNDEKIPIQRLISAMPQDIKHFFSEELLIECSIMGSALPYLLFKDLYHGVLVAINSAPNLASAEAASQLIPEFIKATDQPSSQPARDVADKIRQIVMPQTDVTIEALRELNNQVIHRLNQCSLSK